MHDLPEAVMRAADGLYKWRGIEEMGGKDVLAWVMSDGTYGFAVQGPALRIERCFGEQGWPINNHQGYSDVALQKALGLDAHLERGHGWVGVEGGIGQTMSEGRVSIDEAEPAITSVLSHVLDDHSVHFTLMPTEGAPWNVGDTCTPYYSAKKRKMLCGKPPGGTISVEVDASFRSGEMERRENVPGIDFCTIADRIDETEGGIVGTTTGDDTFLLTHSFNLDPKYNVGSPKEAAAAIVRCGGMLYPSLALSDVPASNFGTCCLVARLPVALRMLKPYKARSRGAWPVTIYHTDAWTETTRNFVSNASATLFEQLTGLWEPFSNGHMMMLGPMSRDYAGPANAKIISSVSQLRSTLKKKRNRWKRSMTVAQIEAASDMSDLRYPYLEVKVNGILGIPNTFPIAVCPTYLKSRTQEFLKAIGFNGRLLTIPIAGEFKDILRQDKSVSIYETARAQWDYAWMVRDAVVGWQEGVDAKSKNYQQDWKEHIIDSGNGFNQPKL